MEKNGGEKKKIGPLPFIEKTFQRPGGGLGNLAKNLRLYNIRQSW